MSGVRDKLVLRPEVSRPDGAPGASHVCISPDGAKLAYSVTEGVPGVAPGLYVAPIGTGMSALCLVTYVPAVQGGWVAEELSFSPDGAHVAYVKGGGPPPGGGRGVGWASTTSPGELGHVPAASFAWTPKGQALVVADLERERVLRFAMSGGPPQELAPIHDDGDPMFPPRIAVSPDGLRVAFTSRRVDDDVTEVFVTTRESTGPKTTLLTEIPGVGVHVRPFWSPKGHTLAMLVVHLGQSKSAIIAVPKLEGEGVVLYENELIDLAEPPAWSPSGRSIAFFHVEAPRHEFTKSGPARLVLLDVSAGAEGEPAPRAALTAPDELVGVPHFLDDNRLAIDAGGAAHVLTLTDAA